MPSRARISFDVLVDDRRLGRVIETWNGDWRAYAADRTDLGGFRTATEARAEVVAASGRSRAPQTRAAHRRAL